MVNICVTGIWHQGTVVSACLADLGNNVHGVCDERNVTLLNSGQPPVHEPGLPEILQRNLKAGRLSYTTNYEEGLEGAEFVFISTDTPVNMNDDSDLSPIYAIAENIGKNIRNDIILCVTAQVPIGTTEDLAKVVRSLAPAHVCSVAYVPEFLRLGIAVETFRQADRFVIGCNEPDVARRVAALYEPIGRPIVFTDIRSAEMAKHASNVFLSTSISFINEIANLCEVLGANALEVARILKMDKRIGEKAFLSPGLGFAGGTLGREIRALQKLAITRQISTPLLDAVWEINAERPQLVSHRLRAALGTLEGHQIGILGLTYKAGTSTLRRAISLDIVRGLVEQGVEVKAFDPLANLTEVSDLPPMQMCSDPYEVAQGSSALVLITEWADINSLDLYRLRRAMRGDVFLDTRNLLDPVRMAQAGFRYFGIGR
ncbi:MAG: nucleotide sugar dehydrogenase [Thermodesulfobacteriota bacterium]|nr:nucleotide sugar dehydrogenase [Thermodesulfobacteriota bacterium]